MARTQSDNLSPPVFYILLALGDGPSHGYQIMQDVEERTQGAVRLLPGSMYSTLKRMLAGGLVEEVAPPADETDERRRYYRITGKGREAAQREVNRLGHLIELARSKSYSTQEIQPERGRG